MDISHRFEGKVTIATVVGNVDINSSDEFYHYLKLIIQSDDTTGVVLNFENLDMIDSTGLGMVVTVYKSLLGKNKKFALCNLKQSVHFVFSVTHIDKIISIFKSEPKAIDFVNNPLPD